MEQDFELVFTLPHFNSDNGIGDSLIRDGTILDLAAAYSCGNVERSKRKNDNDLNQSESLRNRPRGQTSWAEPNPTGLGVNELWSKGIPAQSQCPFFSGATQRQESATTRQRGRVVGWSLTSRNIFTIFSGGIKIFFFISGRLDPKKNRSTVCSAIPAKRASLRDSFLLVQISFKLRRFRLSRVEL